MRYFLGGPPKQITTTQFVNKILTKKFREINFYGEFLWQA